MTVKNRVRPKKYLARCKFCNQNVWNVNRVKKHGCCTKACKESYYVLIGKKKDPLSEELILKYKRYGGSMYTTLRWLRLRKKVFERDKKCLRCGSDKNLHCDHIKPVSWCKGYYWQMSNLQTLCGYCNLSKSNKNDIDYRTVNI